MHEICTYTNQYFFRIHINYAHYLIKEIHFLSVKRKLKFLDFLIVFNETTGSGRFSSNVVIRRDSCCPIFKSNSFKESICHRRSVRIFSSLTIQSFVFLNS